MFLQALAAVVELLLEVIDYSEQKRATVQCLHRPQGATRAITKGAFAVEKRTLNGFEDWCLKKVVIQMIP
jgi:hypothetical protein